MIKINFKQPKYIFPLVIFVPLCALVPVQSLTRVNLHVLALAIV